MTRTLETSKLFAYVTFTPGDSIDRMDVVMNNVGDVGEAVAKGVGTGLTLGLAGSMVTDGYFFTATYQAVGKEPVRKVYKHALHSTVGNAKDPEGLEPVAC